MSQAVVVNTVTAAMTADVRTVRGHSSDGSDNPGGSGGAGVPAYAKQNRVNRTDGPRESTDAKICRFVVPVDR